jgi:hypothetical protein
MWPGVKISPARQKPLVRAGAGWHRLSRVRPCIREVPVRLMPAPTQCSRVDDRSRSPRCRSEATRRRTSTVSPEAAATATAPSTSGCHRLRPRETSRTMRAGPSRSRRSGRRGCSRSSRPRTDAESEQVVGKLVGWASSMVELPRGVLEVVRDRPQRSVDRERHTSRVDGTCQPPR